MRTSESSTRKLLGIEKLTEYTLATETGELAFFIVKPTNIGVLPESSITERKGNGTGAAAGFRGQIWADAAFQPLEIQEYSLRAAPCLSPNLLRENCPSTCELAIFEGFLRPTSAICWR